MASKQAKQVTFGYLEVATALVKAAGLHEGIWRVALEFGRVAAVNANVQVGPTATKLMPAAFLPVAGIRLVRCEELNDLAVDASVVNPSSRIVLPEFAYNATRN